MSMKQATSWRDVTNDRFDNRTTTGLYAGKRVDLPRMPCGPESDHVLIPDFRRTPFPVLICFDITLSTAQGQWFSGTLGADFRHDTFFYGPIQQALTRTTYQKTFIVSSDSMDESLEKAAYPEVLRLTTNFVVFL